MPFTISHMAAVVPLARNRTFLLPFAALAIGSMAPDLLYFVPGIINYGLYLHQPVYAFTVGFVFALCVWAVWRVLAPGVYNICPDFVRKRWHPVSWRSHKAWQVILGVHVGIATHLLFDSFTHSWGWGTRNIGFFGDTYSTPLGNLTGYELAQNALSGIGLLVLVVLVVRLPARDTLPSSAPRLQRLVTWLVPSACVAGALIRTALVGGFDSRYEALAFYLLTGAVAAGALVVVVLGAYSSFSSPRHVRVTNEQ